MLETRPGARVPADAGNGPPDVLSPPRPRRRGRLLPVLSALLALAAMAVALLGLLHPGHDLTTHPSALVTGRSATAIIDANNSPTVVVNPVNSANIVTVDRVDRPRYSAGAHWSLDGGATWADTALPLPAGRDRPYAPDAAFNLQGVLYVLYVNLEGIGNDPQTLWLARSHDGGQSFEPPVAVAGRLSFQARLAVDRSGRVYVSWVKASSVGTLTMGPAAVVVATSTDDGSTFSAPVQVSDARRPRVGAPAPAVDPSGNVTLLYEDFGDDVRDFQNLDGPPWQHPFSLVASRSTDHGRTFSAGVIVDGGLVATERFLVYLPRFPSIAASPDGSLSVAWSDGRSGADAVLLSRSRDGGQSWSSAQPLPGQPTGAGISAWAPRLAVAPDGRVDVLYLAGHRDTSDGLIDAYLATSDDAAGSFRTVKLSSRSFDSRVGPLTGPTYLAPDLGSKLGLASTDTAALAAWADTRLGTSDSGRQDVAVARVDVSGPRISPALLAVAGLLLLLAAAAAVPVVADLAARRRGRAGAP